MITVPANGGCAWLEDPATARGISLLAQGYLQGVLTLVMTFSRVTTEASSADEKSDVFGTLEGRMADRLTHMEPEYFAAPFEAPEWRRRYTTSG